MNEIIATITEQAKENGASLAALGNTVGLSRATFYRLRSSPPLPESTDTDLREAIQQIALEFPGYGYRRITAQLARQGERVNHKRVLRLMREDNLLCLRKRRFVRTTDSEHGLPVYQNLAAKLVVNALNQLWVSDITYIRLESEFVYLAVVLDAFSRRVVGWHLSRRLDAGLSVAALRMALKERKPVPNSGLVHHSDRGVQYAATEYTEILRQNGIQISMSRVGNPYDNAKAESFMKTLKYEQVYLCEYGNLAEAKQSIGTFIECVYNQKRLHSALGYLSPSEFEEIHRKANELNQPKEQEERATL